MRKSIANVSDQTATVLGLNFKLMLCEFDRVPLIARKRVPRLHRRSVDVDPQFFSAPRFAAEKPVEDHREMLKQGIRCFQQAGTRTLTPGNLVAKNAVKVLPEDNC